MRRPILSSALLAGLVAGGLSAQAPSDSSGVRISAIGLELLTAAGDGYGTTALAYRHTRIEPGDAGFEFGLTAFAADPFPILVPEFGAAWSTPGRAPRLLVRAGLSTIWFAMPGFYAGLSLLAPDAEAMVRFDVTWRKTMPVSEGEMELSILTAGVAIAFSSRRP